MKKKKKTVSLTTLVGNVLIIVIPLRFPTVRRRNRCCFSARRSECRCDAVRCQTRRPRPWLLAEVSVLFCFIIYFCLDVSEAARA